MTKEYKRLEEIGQMVSVMDVSGGVQSALPLRYKGRKAFAFFEVSDITLFVMSNRGTDTCDIIGIDYNPHHHLYKLVIVQEKIDYRQAVSLLSQMCNDIGVFL